MKQLATIALVIIPIAAITFAVVQNETPQQNNPTTAVKNDKTTKNKRSCCKSKQNQVAKQSCKSKQTQVANKSCCKSKQAQATQITAANAETTANTTTQVTAKQEGCCKETTNGEAPSCCKEKVNTAQVSNEEAPACCEEKINAASTEAKVETVANPQVEAVVATEEEDCCSKAEGNGEGPCCEKTAETKTEATETTAKE